MNNDSTTFPGQHVQSGILPDGSIFLITSLPEGTKFFIGDLITQSFKAANLEETAHE